MNMGNSNLTFQLDGTGEFRISDGGSVFATFDDVGNVTLANDVSLGSSGAADYIDIGSSNTDRISVLGEIDSGLIPFSTAQNLGSDGNRWGEAYLDAGSLHIGTSITDEAVLEYITLGNRLDISTDATSNGDISFFTSQLFLDKSTGRVGIRNGNPSYGLDFAPPNSALLGGGAAPFNNGSLHIGPVTYTIPEGGGATYFAGTRLDAPSVTGTSGGVQETVGRTATLYVANAPTVSENVTVGTGNYALLVDAGTSRFDATVDVMGTTNLNAQTNIGDQPSDNVTVNSNTWTFANDTNFVLSGGLNGLNFDSGTFSVDAANNWIGMGTNNPDSALDIVPSPITLIGGGAAPFNNSSLHLHNATHTIQDGGNATLFMGTRIDTPTLVGTAGGATEQVARAATVYIQNEPSISGVTLTNESYALLVDGGTAGFDGRIEAGVHPTGGLRLPTVTGTPSAVADTEEGDVVWSWSQVGK